VVDHRRDFPDEEADWGAQAWDEAVTIC